MTVFTALDVGTIAGVEDPRLNSLEGAAPAPLDFSVEGERGFLAAVRTGMWPDEIFDLFWVVTDLDGTVLAATNLTEDQDVEYRGKAATLTWNSDTGVWRVVVTSNSGGWNPKLLIVEITVDETGRIASAQVIEEVAPGSGPTSTIRPSFSLTP